MIMIKTSVRLLQCCKSLCKYFKEISYFLNKMNLTISIYKLPSPHNVVPQLSEKYLKMATDKQELQTALWYK